ncbi:hypothetical protein [Saccharopolyspora montiporae]|uniref:hypothetical protein n=1 Tax=Saccharopolyspora montiporae TaxID=2781240 RepID=UPI001D13A4F0|nr:hypothetical protein [Saccharopolyspora sp. HNM0983]
MDGFVRLDDASVVRRLRRSGRRREPLGFGWGEVVALATPVVWLVLDEAAKAAAGAVVDGAANGLKGLWRRVVRKKSSDVIVPPLTVEQLDHLRQQLVEAATQQGWEREAAQGIADQVVDRLQRRTRDDSDGTSTTA